jgi:hypothetical protein
MRTVTKFAAAEAILLVSLALLAEAEPGMLVSI